MTSSINTAYPVQGRPTTASVRSNFAYAKSEIEALQNKTTGLVNVTEYGAVGDGVTDDKTSFESAGAASSVVIVPGLNYTFGSQPFANNTSFIAFGAEITGSIYPPGAAAIGSTYGNSNIVFSLYSASAGTGTGGSANQHGIVSGAYVPSTSSAASYEKTAGFFRISTIDPSDGSILRDAVAVQATCDILATNTDGRAWALHGYASIASGADGLLYGAELEVYNNGTEGNAPGTALQKYGLHIVAQGTQNSTAGVYIAGNTVKWTHGIWCGGATVLEKNYITLHDAMAVDKDGRIVSGKSTTDAATQVKVQAFASSGNAYVKCEAGNTAEAGIQLTHTGTRNYWIGHSTTTGVLIIGTGTALTTTRAITIDGNTSISLMTNTPSLGGGEKVLMIGNCVAAPSTNPSDGGILYVESGALKYRGSSGTVTTLGDA